MTEPRTCAPTLYVIVAVKLVRAVLCVAIALLVFSHAGPGLRPGFDATVKHLRLDAETRFLKRLGDRIEAFTPGDERRTAAAVLLYGLLLVAEGTGLAFRARWAGLLVAAQSGVLVVGELYALIREPSVTIVMILGVNVAIALYLHRNRARLFAHARASLTSSTGR